MKENKQIIIAVLVAVGSWLLLAAIGGIGKEEIAVLQKGLREILSLAMGTIIYLMKPKGKIEPAPEIEHLGAKSQTIEPNQPDPYEELYQKLVNDYNNLYDWGTKIEADALQIKKANTDLDRRQKLFRISLLCGLLIALLTCAVGFLVKFEPGALLKMFLGGGVAFALGGGILGVAVALFVPSAERRHPLKVGLFTALFVGTVSTLMGLPYHAQNSWTQSVDLFGREFPQLLVIVAGRLMVLPVISMLAAFITYAVTKASFAKPKE